MAAQCKVCKAQAETIAAQKTAIDTLVEMVNLQRAIPAAPAAAPPEVGHIPPAQLIGLPTLEGVEDDIEDVIAQLNAPGTDEETAERLLSQVQAFNSRVERAE